MVKLEFVEEDGVEEVFTKEVIVEERIENA
jgi:hypothetical protein